MTDAKAFHLLLSQYTCFQNRATCNKECSSCSYSTDLKETKEAYTYVLAVLKARDPMLYFGQTIQQLTSTMQNDLNKENSTDE